MQRLLVLVGALAVLVAGCGDGAGSDNDEAKTEERETTTETAAEDQIDGRALEDEFVSFGIESAACPDSIDIVDGEQIECELSNAPGMPGEATTATVTVCLDCTEPSQCQAQDVLLWELAAGGEGCFALPLGESP